MQAIITELVFEHALRIRMKAETSDNVASDDSAAPTAVATPDNASVADAEAASTSAGSDGETDVGTTTHSAESSTATAVGTVKGKDKGKGKDKEDGAKAAPPPKAEDKAGAGKNLVGRINNLVSSDLSSLEWCSMHLVFASASCSASCCQIVGELTWCFRSDRVAVPDHVVYDLLAPDLGLEVCYSSVATLYGVRLTRHTAAYSAWVGFATMIVSLPVPGLITKYIRNTQREKMKRVCHMFTFDLSMPDTFVKDRCSCAACH